MYKICTIALLSIPLHAKPTRSTSHFTLSYIKLFDFLYGQRWATNVKTFRKTVVAPSVVHQAVCHYLRKSLTHSLRTPGMTQFFFCVIYRGRAKRKYFSLIHLGYIPLHTRHLRIICRRASLWMYTPRTYYGGGTCEFPSAFVTISIPGARIGTTTSKSPPNQVLMGWLYPPIPWLGGTGCPGLFELPATLIPIGLRS